MDKNKAPHSANLLCWSVCSPWIVMYLLSAGVGGGRQHGGVDITGKVKVAQTVAEELVRGPT